MNQFSINDFSSEEKILEIASDPFPSYTLYKRNGKFGLFENDIPEMGYYTYKLTPVGDVLGYDFAFFCDLYPIDYMKNASWCGYLALGTKKEWVIYNLGYDFPARVMAKGEVLNDAIYELMTVIGLKPREAWQDLSNKPIVEQWSVAPSVITTLEENQIFVFGSNRRGEHLDGAAHDAYEKFGAVWGEGIGLHGQSYAIPTMGESLKQIRSYVDDFLFFASRHPEYHFLVTRIGCGRAGYSDEQIASLFNYCSLPDNVSLPQSFYQVLDDMMRGEAVDLFVSTADDQKRITEDEEKAAHQKRVNYFVRKMTDIPSHLRERAAERAIINQDRYYSLLRSTGLEGVEDLIAAIHKSNFSTAHSCSHHHYSSGTMEHCLGVYDLMKKSATPGQFSDTELVLVGLLHDVCMGYSSEWRGYGGHGDRSLSIAKKYLPAIQEPKYREVQIAISSHRHDPSGNHPLWALVREADKKDASTCNTGYKF